MDKLSWRERNFNNFKGRCIVSATLLTEKKKKREEKLALRQNEAQKVGETLRGRRQVQHSTAGSLGMGDVRGGGNRPAWLQQYDLVGKIGEGTYGLVFLARTSHRKGCIAIKKFKQSKEGDGVSPTAIREIMVRLSSP